MDFDWVDYALDETEYDDWKLSPDSRYVRFCYQQEGNDWKNFGFWDVKNNKTMDEDELRWIKFSRPKFTRDSRGVFYGRFATPTANNQSGFDTEKLHNFGLYFHKFGTEQEKDVLLYKIDKYPFKTGSYWLSNSGKYLWADMDEGEKNVFGYFNLEEIGPDWMEQALPEPTWLTKLDFSEFIFSIRTSENTILIMTDIGTRTGYDRRIIEIDLDNPKRENWKEVMHEDMFMKDALIESIFVADEKLVVKYFVNDTNFLYVYKLEQPITSESLLKVINMPDNGYIDDE
jgi:prolyl oligopeptidase